VAANGVESRPWVVSRDDLDAIALGAGLLGSGGGGPPELGKLLVIEALRRTRPITIMPESMVDAAFLVVAVAQVGTPMVFGERLARGTEPSGAVRALEAHLGRQAGAIMCDEIGGTNSMTPLLAAAYLELPVVDGDAMGRALPRLHMNALSIYAEGPIPCAFCDDEGNTVIVPGTRDRAVGARHNRGDGGSELHCSARAARRDTPAGHHPRQLHSRTSYRPGPTRGGGATKTCRA
jgi:DUF917 family protein